MLLTKKTILVSLSGFRDKKSKELISLIMFNAKNTSNLILNLSDINYQKTGVTALALYEAIKQSKTKNINFDFNGSNSLMDLMINIAMGAIIDYILK